MGNRPRWTLRSALVVGGLALTPTAIIAGGLGDSFAPADHALHVFCAVVGLVGVAFVVVGASWFACRALGRRRTRSTPHR